jgi:hypothetical protein
MATTTLRRIHAATTYTTGTAGDSDVATIGDISESHPVGTQDVYLTVRSVGTYSNLLIRTTADATTADSTFTFQAATTNLSQSTVVTHAVPGEYEDTTHTDVVSAGQVINHHALNGGGGSFTKSVQGMLFAATVNTSAWIGGYNHVNSTNSATLFDRLGGASGVNQASEVANMQIQFQTAGTLKNGCINASANATGDSTISTRINSGNGTIAIPTTTNASGQSEDTSHSDAVAVGDLVNWKMVTGVLGPKANGLWACVFETTDGSQMVGAQTAAGSQNTSFATNVTSYVGLQGNLAGQVTENDCKTKIGVIGTLSRYETYVDSDAITNTSAVRIRKNGANGNGLLSIPGSQAAAWITDTSDNDALIATDELDWQVIGGTTGAGPLKLCFIGAKLFGLGETYPVWDAKSNSGYQAATSSLSWSHTWNGADRFLAINIELLSVTDTVTAMTYGGANCTFVGAQNVIGGTGRVEMWRICQKDTGAPAAGANTISVTISGSLACAGTAVSYTGVSQGSPTEAFNSNSGINVGAANATVTVTPITDKTVVIAACATNDATATANQTGRNDVTGAAGSGIDEDSGATPISPAAAQTMTVAVAALKAWTIAGYAIRPLLAADLTYVPQPMPWFFEETVEELVYG